MLAEAVGSFNFLLLALLSAVHFALNLNDVLLRKLIISRCGGIMMGRVSVQTWHFPVY